ncbi:MAG TPA: 6-phosphogluconolactonase [Vicinamibacterales bacterium]|nr:6-phosphogluconolactonase [Vicinamibacterales bacterium]
MPQQPSSPDVRVFADEDALARAVASAASETIVQAVAAHGRCGVALSGGSTPRALYRVLASSFRDRIPWQQVQIFWGDERFVAATDPRNNYGMAKATLLDHVPCPSGNIHPIPTHLDTAAAAADAYDAELCAYFGDRWPRFDLILLGIGEDCHTASLFPHSSALAERDRRVVSTLPEDGTEGAVARVTLTMPALWAARTVFVLVAGERKSRALRRALAPATKTDECPASALRRSNGTVVWWVDRAAAPPPTED